MSLEIHGCCDILSCFCLFIFFPSTCFFHWLSIVLSSVWRLIVEKRVFFACVSYVASCSVFPLLTKLAHPTDKRWHRCLWLFQGQTLFLGTDQSVAQMSVVTCDAYRKVDLCIYDPYCGWDVNTNECVHAIKTHRWDRESNTWGRVTLCVCVCEIKKNMQKSSSNFSVVIE